jgi:hypothetical protein
MPSLQRRALFYKSNNLLQSLPRPIALSSVICVDPKEFVHLIADGYEFSHTLRVGASAKDAQRVDVHVATRDEYQGLCTALRYRGQDVPVEPT